MIALRPLVAQDRDAFQAFVRRLSAQSRLNRFLAPIRDLSPAALDALLQAARRSGLKALEGEVLRTNAAMLGFVRRLGFRVKSCPGEAHLVIAERELDGACLAA